MNPSNSPTETIDGRISKLETLADTVDKLLHDAVQMPLPIGGAS